MKVLQELHSVYNETQEEGWDGYGGMIVLHTTYEYVIRFIDLLPFDMPPPEITPEPDGEIALEWYGEDGAIFSVSVGSEGELTYLNYPVYHCDYNRGTEWLDNEIPEILLYHIRNINQPS
jgi:hypothetical protein